ncbi:MAG: pyridoxal phosphate-dependent aminotransferase [Atribacterota bacterium]|nr:pyridoxal phosphate-dependent aminotransferase [Atribacterota bacterium]MDD4765617.1 pyridoxal phosphate-dependent aminotransferase [Atribacterota bacterium]MDD5635372.1 pyridoxal phosphate-dependent aminotransferase [Atribacterota bacterium]
MILSERINNIKASQTLAINAQILRMKDEGKKIISFGAGEPDFSTPQNIQKAAIKAIKDGFTHYTTSSGIIELKKAIIKKLKLDNNLNYDVNEIIISNGAKHSLYNTLMTLCNPGDEVILPTPCWVSYAEQIKLAQAKPIFVKTNPISQFQVLIKEIEKNITNKTKAILLNSPNNPTGAVYSKEDLQKIGNLLVKKDIYCISDEVYEKLVYDDSEHVSIASLGSNIKSRVILINGVSKTYAMTGWRIGYAAGPKEVIAGMNKLQGQCTSNANSIAQKASVEALVGNQESIKYMRNEFDKRRKYIVKELNSINGFSCDLPKGAFYVFPNIKKLLNAGIVFNDMVIKDSLQLANYILNKVEVAVVPGSAFESEGYLRLSYATSMQDIEEGMKRLKDLFN